jgi:uncharacterized membrane protein YfcA
MDRFLGIIIIIVLIVVSITYLLNRFFYRKKYVKYIFPIALFALAVYYIYTAKTVSSEGFRQLGQVLVAIMFGIGAISGLLSALFFDLILPNFKKR